MLEPREEEGGRSGEEGEQREGGGLRRRREEVWRGEEEHVKVQEEVRGECEMEPY